ncbi:MAG: hypothetical protein ABGX27_04035 [Desulfurobacteriaceae bacterium]
MNWVEFSNGEKLLKEAGWRYGMEIHGTEKNPYQKEPYLYPTVAIYSGSVDYNGQTMDGTPSKTNVNYKGIRSEVALNFPLYANENTFWSIVFFSIEGDRWDRDIVSTSQALGYLEKWFVLSWKTGIKIGRGYPEGFKGSFWLGSSFLTTNTVDLFGVTVEPQGTLFLGADFKLLNRLGEYLFEEGLFVRYRHWDKSPAELAIVDNSLMSVWQPESEELTFGVFVGITF